jgi:threonine aldolase
MLKAISLAKVGDDVFGEDPSVNELQERMAELLGKQAALFVPSGTMSNQLAIKSHTQPGDELICEKGAHCFNYEGGGSALLSGVQVYPLAGKRGVITVEQIDAVIRPFNDHFPRSRLIVLENTHNKAGGTIFPINEMQRIHTFAQERGLLIHLDGARLFNAHVTTGVPLNEYGQNCDSVSLCLSKGLGAPVGTVLVGDKAFIEKAHRYRKIFGGGMRQAGFLASAGLYALDHHIQRLKNDHERAQKLGGFLNSLPNVTVDLKTVQTNIVLADFTDSPWDAHQLQDALKEKGVLCIAFSKNHIRFVTHLDIDDQDMEDAMSILGDVYKTGLNHII